MRLSYKTRENLSPQGKPRVYYTGHTDDFSLYFEQIAEEILELHNCVIYYDAERLEDTEGKSKQEDVRAAKLTEEEKYELGQMQLFVIPVTGRFLFEPNRARKVEFPFAIMNHIPILPLIQGSGLEAQFNQICGNLQMLDAGCQDPTALPYEEKLKHFLNSVLVGDELAEKIRGAFDAYVFLSYRKKDRIYAQELMRLIHKNKFCRDIAIWYDEFLTLGENFNTEIENALEKSELFVLAVTPHILEPGNYVMTTEYPAARESGKPVFPVELKETDKKQLKKYYQNLPSCADMGDEDLLQKNLYQAVRQIAVREKDSSPEHNFFIGLAYLKGIDVEVDHDRALQLITGAAEDGLLEAAGKLVDIYRNGEGTGRDYPLALRWQERLTDQIELQYTKTREKGDGEKWAYALCDLGDYRKESAELSAAKEAYQKMQEICVELSEQSDDKAFQRALALSYVKLGDIETGEGNWNLAEDYYTEAYRLRKALYDENSSIQAEQEMADVCNRLGTICKQQNNMMSARLFYLNALQACLRLCDISSSPRTKRELSRSYNNLGRIYEQEGNLDGAKDLYLRQLSLDKQRCAEAKHNLSVEWDYAGSLNGMGNICRREGSLAEAKGYYLQSLELTERICRELQTAEARKGFMRSCRNFGGILAKEGLLDEAENYYGRSYEESRLLLEEAQTFETKKEFLTSCLDMCDICRRKGELLKAKKYCLVHLELFDCFGKKTAAPQEKKLLALAYSKAGNICKRMGEPEEAMEHYQSCIRLCEEIYAETKTEQAERDLKASYANAESVSGKQKEKAAENEGRQNKLFHGMAERLRHVIKK